MNYIATVNTPAHGTISVTYSDIEKNILGAWREEETIQLSGKEKQQIANDIICNRRFTRVFEKAYVTTSGFGVFIFPVRSGRFCQSKLIELATQIAVWIKTGSLTMLLSAKTSFTKPVSTRGRSLAGSS